MKQLFWLPEARADLRRLVEFLMDVNPHAAAKAARAIQGQARQLQEAPEIGRPMGDGTGRREFFVPFGAGAYVLRYRLHAERVVVIRVWHSREHQA